MEHQLQKEHQKQTVFVRFRQVQVLGERVVLGVYAALGIVFSAIALVSAFGVVAAFVSRGYTIDAWVLEAGTYLLLNIIIAGGLFYARRWLLVVVGVNILQLVSAPTIKVLTGGASEPLPVLALALSTGILVFLVASRKMLVGPYVSTSAVVALLLIASLTL